MCGAPRASDGTHCSRCGFPRALESLLAPRGERPSRLAGPEASADPDARPTPEGTLAPLAPSPTGAPVGEILRLGAVLEPHRPEEPGSAGKLAQAAVDEALGDRSSAERAVQEELGRLRQAAQLAVAQHRDRLRARRRTLTESGIDLPAEPTLDDAGDHSEGTDQRSTLEALAQAEGRLRHVEGVWQELEQQFERIATVRTIAAQFGWSIVGIPSRVEGLRASLRAGHVRFEVVEQASREAADELSELFEALNEPVRSELANFRRSREEPREDPVAAHRVRALLARAERHLDERRLADALRDLLEAGAKPVAAGSTDAPSATTPADEPSGGVSVVSLREKARGLAEHIRALPAESETARRAAAEIREATELLRQGRLTDADAILTRLKRSVGTPPPSSEDS